MKTLIMLGLTLLPWVNLRGQGCAITFANNAVTRVTNALDGVPLPVGTSFKAALWVLPDGTPPSNTDFDAFGVGVGQTGFALPGIFNGCAGTISSFPGGGFWWCQMRVWETAFGASYQAARSNTNALGGRLALVGHSLITRVRIGCSGLPVPGPCCGQFTPPCGLLGFAVAPVAILPPTVVSSPANQTVAAGSTAELAIQATGFGPLSFQWRRNGTNLTSGPRVQGAATATLTISNVHNIDGGSYSVVVSNAGGAVTSAPPGILTVDGCNYLLDPVEKFHGAAEGTGEIVVTTGPSCVWEARASQPWVTITSGPTGHGDGTVHYVLSANPAARSRSDMLMVGALEAISYDDGAEDLLAWTSVGGDGLALRFTPPGYPFHLTGASLNLVNYPAAAPGAFPNGSVEVRVYAENSGQPGPLVRGGMPFASRNIPVNGHRWVDVDWPDQVITIVEGDFFLSVHWVSTNGVAVGLDTSLPSEGRTWVHENGIWNILPEVIPDYPDAQLMVRARGTVRLPPALVRLTQAQAPHFGPLVAQGAGMIELTLFAEAGKSCVVDASPDLATWMPIYTNVAAEGVFTFRDTQAGGSPVRFYRAREE